MTTALVAFVFAVPMLGGGVFWVDWRNHLWLVAKQTSYVREHLAPTFFFNTVDYGWFYPFFAFYGGTLYYVTALAGAAVGSPWVAYVSSYLLAVAAAFHGWTWLSRQASITNWTAYLPGGVFVAAAYYLTDAYGRGAWTEFMAISMIPLVLAAGCSLLTARTPTPSAGAVFVVALVILTGSHSITLFYGTLFVLAAFLIGLLVDPKAVRRHRLSLTIWVGVLSICINAWFLVPLIAYLPTIGLHIEDQLHYREFDTFAVIFSLVPTNPWADSTPQLYVQAPVIPIVVSSVVICVAALVVRCRKLLMTALATAAGFGSILFFILAPADVWARLPPVLFVIQFPYRLNAYLLMCAAGLVLVACRYSSIVQRRGGLYARLGDGFQKVLGLATAIQVGFGIVQAFTAGIYAYAPDVYADLDHLPPQWVDRYYFNASVVRITDEAVARPSARALTSDLAATKVEAVIPDMTPGAEMLTDFIPGPLVNFAPFEVVGQLNGHAVLRVPSSGAPDSIIVGPAATPETTRGSIVSALGVLGAVGVVGVLFVRQRLHT